MSLFQQLIQFLSSPPDSLVYHVVTLLALQASLALALWQTRRHPDDIFSRRLAWASAGIIVARLIFLFASIVVAGPQEATGVLPPLERAIDAVTIALLVWALAPHSRRLPRLGDVILIILLLVILLMYAFFAQEWMAEVELGSITIEYTATQQSAIWDLFQIGLLLTGSVLILLAMESDWTLRLTILLILTTVHVASLFAKPVSGQAATDVAYWVRLGNLIVFPLLVVLTYRHTLPDIVPAGKEGISAGQLIMLIEQLRELVRSTELESTIDRSIKFSNDILKTNLSAIAIAHGDQLEELTLYSQWIEPGNQAIINRKTSQIVVDDWPVFKQVFQKQEQSLLQADGLGARQLYNLSQQMEFRHLRSALLTPLKYLDNNLGISMVGTSSDRIHWTPELKATAVAIAGLLAEIIYIAGSKHKTSESEAESALEPAHQMESLISSDWVLRTVTRYSGELETAQIQIESLESKITDQLDVASFLPISSKISALRTPLTAVGVYTQLLLDEGQTLSPSKQKSLLQRVQANTDNMAVVIEDLARSVRSAKPMTLLNKPVDIQEAIEASVGTIQDAQRHKRLKVDLILDDKLPLLYAPDRAFLQIMRYLLSCACYHTSVDGRISITAHTDTLYESFETELPGSATFLHVAIIGRPVSPSGNDNPGPTQAAAASPAKETPENRQGPVDQEISLATELVSSCNGRIWIDLESKDSSQFSFLIPIDQTTSEKDK